MMTVQACTFFLACAFYLAYYAESGLLGHDARRFVWAMSFILWSIPTAALIYQIVRRVFF